MDVFEGGERAGRAARVRDRVVLPPASRPLRVVREDGVALRNRREPYMVDLVSRVFRGPFLCRTLARLAARYSVLITLVVGL